MIAFNNLKKFVTESEIVQLNTNLILNLVAWMLIVPILNYLENYAIFKVIK